MAATEFVGVMMMKRKQRPGWAGHCHSCVEQYLNRVWCAMDGIHQSQGVYPSLTEKFRVLLYIGHEYMYVIYQWV